MLLLNWSRKISESDMSKDSSVKHNPQPDKVIKELLVWEEILKHSRNKSSETVLWSKEVWRKKEKP